MRPSRGNIATYRKASRDYELLERFEAGMILTGGEIKSLREGRANISQAYVRVSENEAWMHSAHIPKYTPAGPYGDHEPERPRKLLLHRKEIDRMKVRVLSKGLTVIPTRIYIRNHVAKVEVALAKGRKAYDKREIIKTRDVEREMARAKKHRI